MNGFELNTTIANLRDLRASELADYDAVYLGDIYCRLYESNFLEQLGDLKEGLHILRDQGKGPTWRRMRRRETTSCRR